VSAAAASRYDGEIGEIFRDSSSIHSEFIAPSFNGPAKNNVVGYRNGNEAWGSSPKGKEGISKNT
jgi:hypothetical protein